MRALLVLLCGLLTTAVAAQPAPTVGTAAAPRVLTPAQMQRDLALVRAAWTSLHPGLYRYTTPVQLDARFQRVLRQTQARLDERAYFVQLSQLAATVHCGHTYLNPWNQTPAVRRRLFADQVLPFLLRVLDGQLVITHNLSADASILPGTVIEALNGVPGRVVIDSLLTVSRTDGQHGRAKQLDNLGIYPLDADTANYALFDIYYPLFFGRGSAPTSYQLTLKPDGQPARAVTVPAVSKAARQAAYAQRFGPLPVHERNWELKFLNSRVGYFRIGDFETWEWKADYKQYLDSVFTAVQRAGVETLIVDIRGNEGGDDEARTEVLSYLVPQRFGCPANQRLLTRYLAIPDTLLPYLKAWNKAAKAPRDPAEYTQTPDGLYEKRPDGAPCAPTTPKAKRFTGEVYLLTNATNSSTAFTLADVIQTTHAGKLVGEPTGGNKQGINGGQFLFLRLPASGFELDIPLTYAAPVVARPDEGIQPDFPVPTTPRDLARGIDAPVAFVLKRVAKKK